jgi:hypothetical protein
MSWTTKEAKNLLKLRTLWCNQDDWEVFWRNSQAMGLAFPQLINIIEEEME